MSHENTDTPLSADMRRAALAAPSAAIERREFNAAHQQAEQERIERLGKSADQVRDLEARLQSAIDDRKRAQNEARFASNKLEQVYQSISTVLGRDIRHLSMVTLGIALSDSASKLTTMASYIGWATTLEDLVVIKRVASNLGVIKPQTMAEAAAQMGLPVRRAV